MKEQNEKLVENWSETSAQREHLVDMYEMLEG